MNLSPLIDETRLTYAERRDHLDIIRRKGRSTAEISLSEQRLQDLAEVGKFLGKCKPHEAAILQIIGDVK